MFTFLNLNFESLKSIQSPFCLLQKSLYNNLLIIRQTACMEPFFLFDGAHLFDEKICQSAVRAVFRARRLGDTKPPSNHKMFK